MWFRCALEGKPMLTSGCPNVMVRQWSGGNSMLRAIAALCLGLGVAADAAAQNCSEIRFAPGASSGEVSGQVTDGQPMCFTFRSGFGQTARLQLFGSENACFTVPGVIDCQGDFSFQTQQQTYTVNVYQLLRSTASEQFALRLTIR